MSSSSRGGGWVAAQFVLMALIVGAVAVPPDWPDTAAVARAVVGVVLVATGAAFAVWAGRTMGRSLTPFPHPPAAGVLVETGPFRVVRHPIYLGGLAFFTGWSLITGPVALALTGALAVLWAGKARVEERHLRRIHPGYADYARRVRTRMIPGVY